MSRHTLKLPCLLLWLLLQSACTFTSHQPEHSTGSRIGEDIALHALSFVGHKYRWGGKNPKQGFDCSGFVSYVYNHASPIKLFGNAYLLSKKGQQIDASSLKPGDLVFFNTRKRPRSHVGIFIGNGRFVHALSTKAGIRVDRLNNSYYKKRFEEARSYL